VKRKRRRDRCLQCNKPIDPEGLRQCDPCRARISLFSKDRAAYLATRVPRGPLADVPPGLRVSWIPRSLNRKLGGIPACIVTPTTCPPSCGFYGQGCYAEFGPMIRHWRRAAEEGLEWPAFLAKVRALPAGRLWRYAIAGDLPGVGEELDGQRLAELIGASFGKRGFAFTHKRPGPFVSAVLAAAAPSGFVVNLSADSLEQADELAAGGLPVAVVVPSDHPQRSRTPEGRHVVVCPAQTHDLDCARCGLCAVAGRKAVVGFRAHGQFAGEISKRMLPVVP